MNREELANKFGKKAWRKGISLARHNSYNQAAKLLRSGASIEAVREILLAEWRGRKARARKETEDLVYKRYCADRAKYIAAILKEVEGVL